MRATNLLRSVGLLALPVLLATTPAYAGPTVQEKATAQVKEPARQSGNAIKDSWVTMKVHSQFVPEDVLEGSDIDVDTKAGIVTLTGTVPTAAGRARAVAIAKATDGVSRVTDRLRIATTEADAASARARESGRQAGEATRETGRQAGEATREAGRDAGAATGTAGRAVTDGWIKSKIYAQFITEDALDDADVDIDISKGVVSLSGVVPSEAARTRAIAIAKATDGVKSVNNNLKVTK